ncbi:MAG: hypothetical protein B6244_11515 [Candidatus Cloacimonetes bacterium 4572_55]|nr:MAG: hypothetical protein B6244_11515 [Candidatus Cloacimonetes bacterium 4572_55]
MFKFRRAMTFIIPIILCIAAPGIGSAQKALYVNVHATGYENGSQSAPFHSIQEAIDHASPETEIHVSSGNYYENVTIDDRRFGLRLLGGYHADNWHWDPEINRTVINGNGWIYCIDVDQCPRVEIIGFFLTNAQNLIRIFNTSQVLVERNELYRSVDYGSSAETNGILINHAEDVTVRHNIIHQIIGKGEKGVGIHINSSPNSTVSNLTVVNNTLFDISRDGVTVGNGSKNLSYPNGVIKNNIIVKTGYSGIRIETSGCLYDYNCFYDCPRDYVSEAARLDLSTHDLLINPLFVDVVNGKFRLDSSSPCVDAGDPLSDYINEPDPNGKRINMGAYGNTNKAALSTGSCPSPPNPPKNIAANPLQFTLYPENWTIGMPRAVPLNNQYPNLYHIWFEKELSSSPDSYPYLYSSDFGSCRGTIPGQKALPYSILIHSFRSDKTGMERALNAAEQLTQDGYAAYWSRGYAHGREWYRVMIGMFDSKEAAVLIIRKFPQSLHNKAAVLELPYTILLSRMRSLEEIYAAAAKLAEHQHSSHYWIEEENGEFWFSLCSGSLADLDVAQRALNQIRALGFEARIIKR